MCGGGWVALIFFLSFRRHLLPHTKTLTCVVDQNVNGLAPKRGQRGLDAGGRERGVGDVAREGRGDASRAFDFFNHALRFGPVQIGHQHFGAVRRKQAGRGGAQALAGAGDDGDLVIGRVDESRGNKKLHVF
jgi:hypothetical protein